MKIFKTINWTFLNFDEIYRIEHESEEKIYSYFYMKNGDKFDVYDVPDRFNIDDDKIYGSCELCHVIINGIILENILRTSELDIYDISKQDDDIWEEFINWARNNCKSLRVIKENVKDDKDG